MAFLARVSKPMHGMRWHEEPGPGGLCWWQYWRGVKHVWYWRGVPLFWRMRRRDRPMHELIKRSIGGCYAAPAPKDPSP